MCEISVIIPFYNSEKYIEDCLNSVIQSSFFEKCEVILIDDGSKDCSVQIVQGIVNVYSNISIYQYPNGGLSAARNRGMQHAVGKYLFFLDSDDYLSDNYLYELYQKAEKTNSEIVFAGFTQVSENKGSKRPVTRNVLNHDQLMTGYQFLNLRMDFGDWNNEVCCALYRRDFLESNKLRFDEDIRLYEDILFTNKILLYAERIQVTPIYGYMYRYHSESLVHSGVKERDIIWGINVLVRFESIYQELDKQKKRALGRVIFAHISMILYYIGEVNPQNKQIYYKVLRSPEILSILRKSVRTCKEAAKYLIFRYCIQLYYPLVRKREYNGDEGHAC